MYLSKDQFVINFYIHNPCRVSPLDVYIFLIFYFFIFYLLYIQKDLKCLKLDNCNHKFVFFLYYLTEIELA